MAKESIIFRADGSSTIGLGHIVRTGALADMIGDGKAKILYTRCAIPSVLEDAQKIFDDIVKLPEEQDYDKEAQFLAAAATTQDIVVLDGYDFNHSYQDIIQSNGASLVCIDDIYSGYFNSAVVINTAGGISPEDYQASPATQFYLGPGYALLRKPFLNTVKDNKATNKHVFICLGGADPGNATLEVLRFLVTLNRFKGFKIVVGAAYRFTDELMAFVASNNLEVNVLKSLNAVEMAQTMASCSYAVCSPSTISYEYMSLGGVLYLKQIADNQKDMLHYLVAEGLAFHLEDAGRTTNIEEQESLQKQLTVFDGKAAARLKKIFDTLFLSTTITIRRARPEDVMYCYDWANDAAVREQSFNSKEIPLADHKIWFAEKLSDEQCFFYILELAGKPIAQIRFQVSKDGATLGYLIDKANRGQGLGTTILSKGIRAFIKDFGNRGSIMGYVKFSNIASQRSFEKLKFRKTTAAAYADAYKYTMEYDGN